MNVALMQPTFMPWQGYFELICKSDIFVLLDDFQFSPRSYHQRNRLFVKKGQVGWYTAPMLRSKSSRIPLNMAVINDEIPWREKMWRRFEYNYSKAPYYVEVAPALEAWLLKKRKSLVEQNIAGLEMACNLLGLPYKFVLSSQYSLDTKRSARIMDLLIRCKATRYLCAQGSFAYMFEDGIFPTDKIEVLFQDFRPKEYPQVGSPDAFIPYLSVFDALMNIGPEKTLELIKNGTERWLTWDDMSSKHRLQSALEEEGSHGN
jgi:hypothetical protein